MKNLLQSKRWWFNIVVIANYLGLQYFEIGAFPTPAPLTVAAVNAILTMLRLRFGI